MAIQRNKLINNEAQWSAKHRYKTNDSVVLNGVVYQNVTGFNSIPTSLIDWKEIKDLNAVTGFQSRTDTVGTQTILSLTDNIIAFTGLLEENGGFELIKPTGQITPVALGDIMSIDFAFTGVVPVGANLFLSIFLIVDGVIFRALTSPIIKGAGLEDNFSISWVLPVTANFLANGGYLYVNPISEMIIKNRYISVCRLAKGN